MRKYAFKFNRQIEGTEDCDATVLAETEQEAFEKFNNKEWATFLIAKRDVKTDMSDTLISSYKDLGIVST
jgi:hypothetical protein